MCGWVRDCASVCVCVCVCVKARVSHACAYVCVGRVYWTLAAFLHNIFFYSYACVCIHTYICTFIGECVYVFITNMYVCSTFLLAAASAAFCNCVSLVFLVFCFVFLFCLLYFLPRLNQFLSPQSLQFIGHLAINGQTPMLFQHSIDTCSYLKLCKRDSLH